MQLSSLEERKAAAVAEYNAVLEWSIKESNKVLDKMKREGRFLYLDGHGEEFAYIKETRRRRLEEIFNKYTLPKERTNGQEI